jgi:hypothetical protein
VPTIESMAPGAVTFLSPDLSTPYHVRRISYSVAGDQLLRAASTSTDTDGVPWVIPAPPAASAVLHGLRSATVFTFRDGGGAVTTTPSAVASIDVSLALDGFASSGTGAKLMSATAWMRTQL